MDGLPVVIDSPVFLQLSCQQGKSFLLNTKRLLGDTAGKAMH
jgi:hypothetical protein